MTLPSQFWLPCNKNKSFPVWKLALYPHLRAKSEIFSIWRINKWYSPVPLAPGSWDKTSQEFLFDFLSMSSVDILFNIITKNVHNSKSFQTVCHWNDLFCLANSINGILSFSFQCKSPCWRKLSYLWGQLQFLNFTVLSFIPYYLIVNTDWSFHITHQLGDINYIKAWGFVYFLPIFMSLLSSKFMLSRECYLLLPGKFFKTPIQISFVWNRVCIWLHNTCTQWPKEWKLWKLTLN